MDDILHLSLVLQEVPVMREWTKLSPAISRILEAWSGTERGQSLLDMICG